MSRNSPTRFVHCRRPLSASTPVGTLAGRVLPLPDASVRDLIHTRATTQVQIEPVAPLPSRRSRGPSRYTRENLRRRRGTATSLYKAAHLSAETRAIAHPYTGAPRTIAQSLSDARSWQVFPGARRSRPWGHRCVFYPHIPIDPAVAPPSRPNRRELGPTARKLKNLNLAGVARSSAPRSNGAIESRSSIAPATRTFVYCSALRSLS
jgi:hypothetical protein